MKKEMKPKYTIKAVLIVLGLVLIAFGIDAAFILMNLASTGALVGGILLLLLSIGLPVELVYLYFKNKRNKTTKK